MSRRKRQKLSVAGRDAVTSYDEAESQPQVELSSEARLKPLVMSKAKSLFVHSLPADATNDDLTEHFSQRYPLKHATIVVDPVNKKSKGYGFVTFADADDAQNARESFNGSVLKGKKIRVELAEPRRRQAAGGDKAPHNETFDPQASAEPWKSKNRQPPKLIVRNLPWTFKEPEQLANLFRSYGKVKFATLPKKQTGLSAGFGFVTLRGVKNAEKALEGVNGKEIHGRTLAVDWAVEKDTWNTLQKQDGTAMADMEDSASTGIVQDDASHEEERDGRILDSVDDAESGFATEEEELMSESIGTSSDGLATSGNIAQDSTLFIRNVPFSITDGAIQEHFSYFGPVRYARIVQDPSTQRSRGTAFVAFYNSEDAEACLKGSHKVQPAPKTAKDTTALKPSLLEDINSDPAGHYTLDGRVLHISQAVDRGEAKRLTITGSSLREVRDKDKRRLYLLSEGTVSAGSPLYDLLSPSEIKIREDSAKQRQALIRSNPSLHLSLTRLSVRNVPRTMTSKDLKELARKAVVGFATDVKEGKRQPMSKEELARGGRASKEAEKARKAKGKGIVKQAKIVFEGLEGGKVQEMSGAGRSRGYGFIEYTSHRWALMGLRWLNGRAVTAQFGGNQQKAGASEERKKRLILEFAIENAQVVARRQEREANAQEAARNSSRKHMTEDMLQPSSIKPSKPITMAKSTTAGKRQEAPTAGSAISSRRRKIIGDSELSKRQHIIRKKRMLRKSRKRGNPT